MSVWQAIICQEAPALLAQLGNIQPMMEAVLAQLVQLVPIPLQEVLAAIAYLDTKSLVVAVQFVVWDIIQLAMTLVLALLVHPTPQQQALEAHRALIAFVLQVTT